MSPNRECTMPLVYGRDSERGREGKKEKEQVARSCNRGMWLELGEQGWRGQTKQV